jgi:hypothetical protein
MVAEFATIQDSLNSCEFSYGSFYFTVRPSGQLAPKIR